MVDGEDNLFRREPDIDRVKNCSEHGHRIKAFKVAMTVPIHHSHGIAWFHPKRGEGVG